MNELREFYSDVESLLAVSREELGARMVHLLIRRIERDRPPGRKIHAGTVLGEFSYDNPQINDYLGKHREQAILAIGEAWAWLESEGLLVYSPGDGHHGWRLLGRRAKEFEDATTQPTPAVRGLLAKRALHPNVAKAAWLPWIRGDFENAVFQAMRQVEIQLRNATGSGGDLPAVKLARTAFATDDGMLTDPKAERSEKEAMAHLFAGVLGVLKNPHSHRAVEMSDPADAAALIMFASYLCGVIDRRWIAFVTS